MGCEFSGIVREAFRKLGHEAYSCDLLPAEDGSANHYQGDVLDVLGMGWDLMIAHPPCTYLANSGNKHLYLEADRFEKRAQAAEFFKALLHADIPGIAIENPIMRRAIETVGRKQDQVIQPWMFGHKEMKATCLWLFNLPKLRATRNVGPPPKDKRERAKWARVHRASPGPDRWKERSRTLQGIADAMAAQWGGVCNE